MRKSTASRRIRKPSKPYPTYPLTIHPSGRYCKKIAGRTWYFGSWKDGPDAALERYRQEKDAIAAGLDPRVPKTTHYTLGRLCNEYLNLKKSKMESGEITARHFKDLLAMCQRLAAFFGELLAVEQVGPDQFERYALGFPKSWRLRRRKREITAVRSLFRYCLDKDKIAKLKFGPAFVPPGKKALDLERQNQERTHGGRLFTQDELRQIITAADQPLRTMILMGCNLGFGNSDCSTITESYINLQTGWHDYPRPKTTISRRGKLWPETVESLREWLTIRPAPARPEYAKRIFLTASGRPWVNTVVSPDGMTVTIQDGITKAFSELLKKLKIKRVGLSFYSLRHVCESFGGLDQVAIDLCMGHTTSGQGTNYRGQIDDARLETVSQNLHNWLYGVVRLHHAEEVAV